MLCRYNSFCSLLCSHGLRICDWGIGQRGKTRKRKLQKDSRLCRNYNQEIFNFKTKDTSWRGHIRRQNWSGFWFWKVFPCFLLCLMNVHDFYPFFSSYFHLGYLDNYCSNVMQKSQLKDDPWDITEITFIQWPEVKMGEEMSKCELKYY